MGIKNKVKSLVGVVSVQVEGFFTERFINLCKFNNITIWDIKNIVNGVVRFNINISDFKKLRKIAKKTKCKVTIKDKKGIYFFAFKYRKRKIMLVLILAILIIVCTFSNFIWNVKVIGNQKISSELILEQFCENGLYVGTFKLGLDKSNIISKVRTQNSDIAWLGVDISGTTAYIKVIEKTKISENEILKTEIGDIICTKPCVITKIIPENGTARVKEGSYVEEGMVLIEGKIYSTIVGIRDVSAKGIVNGKVEYEYVNKYLYTDVVKEYTNKKRWTIGITINSKEYIINYLNKSNKYDRIKYSKSINIFGLEISFDAYSFDEYVEKEVILSYEEITNKAEEDIDMYLNKVILTNCKNGSLIDKTTVITKENDGITFTTKYIINEQVGEFIGRNDEYSS